MIAVTRLNGSEIALNSDLIETVEGTPDTVITLVDGKKYLVRETIEEVVEKIRASRAAILRTADDPVAHSAELYVMPRRD